METIEFAHDTGDGGAGRYGQNVIYQMQENFITSHAFIYRKLKNGKLFCDHCQNEFPANLPFYIVVDEPSERLFCYPCNFLRTGVDPYEEIKKERIIADEARRKRMLAMKAEQDEKNRIANEKIKQKELKEKIKLQKNNQQELF